MENTFHLITYTGDNCASDVMIQAIIAQLIGCEIGLATQTYNVKGNNRALIVSCSDEQAATIQDNVNKHLERIFVGIKNAAMLAVSDGTMKYLLEKGIYKTGKKPSFNPN